MDREIYVTAIAALIRNDKTQAPLTIGIYGPWGSGKSSFLAQLTERLSKYHDVVGFNPWRLNGGGEVWAALVKEIAPIVDRHLGLLQRIRFLWSSNATRGVSKLRTRLAAASKKLGNWLTVVTASGGILAAGHLQETQVPSFLTTTFASLGLNEPLKTLLAWLGAFDLGEVKWGTVVGAATAAIVGAVVLFKLGRTLLRPFSTQFEANQAQFKDKQALKSATYDDFEALRKVIGDFTATRAKHRKPHLVLLIDDLDRCSPDHVIGVLEAVNLFVAELPVITVFAIDTKFVCTAVAARHRFLFAPQDGPNEKERYGRLFLEKIIHVPFQLPAVRSYERYVNELVTVSGDAASDDDASKGVGERVPMPTAKELTQGKILRLPLVLYMKFGVWLIARRADSNQRWKLSINLRLLFGVGLTDEQSNWLTTQDYATQILVRRTEVEFGSKFNPAAMMRFRTIFERAREEMLSTAIKIEESDRTILRVYTANLRGNPRSIKRFINTYQLAKGIKDQRAQPGSDEFGLDDLAAWLVLLQNWPRLGSVLCTQAKAEVQTHEPFLTDNWTERLFPEKEDKPPSDMIAFVQSNWLHLERLASSARGLDIARCFSFFTPQA